MSDNWIVAETYPIEGFWQTQIVLRGGEVVATTAGHTEGQSRKRAEQIAAAEAALSEARHWEEERRVESERLEQQLSETRKERDALKKNRDTYAPKVVTKIRELQQQVTQQAATISTLREALELTNKHLETECWDTMRSPRRQVIAALASIPKVQP